MSKTSLARWTGVALSGVLVAAAVTVIGGANANAVSPSTYAKPVAHKAGAHTSRTAANAAVSAPWTYASTAATFFPQSTVSNASGDVYAADPLHNTIKKLDFGGAVVPEFDPSSAGLVSPTSVALYGADLYVCDSPTEGNTAATLLALNATTGAVDTSFSPSGLGLLGECWITSDGAGNLYVSDQGNGRIIEVDATGAQVAAFAPTLTDLLPGQVAFGAGGVFVGNLNTGDVYKLDPTTGAAIGAFSYGNADVDPLGIAFSAAGVHGATLYIADYYGDQIIPLNATSGSSAGGFSAGDALSNSFSTPIGLSADTAGNLIVSFGSDRPMELSSTGAENQIFNTSLIGISAPYGVAVNPAGNHYAIEGADIVATNSAGQALPSFQSPNDLGFPSGIAADASRVYVTDPGNGDVEVLNATTGAVLNWYTAGGALEAPFGVTVDGPGHIWVTDIATNKITELNGATGAVYTNFKAPTSIASLQGLAVDKDNHLWVADPADSKVIGLNATTGAVQYSSLGTGLQFPVSLAYYDGDLFVGQAAAPGTPSIVEMSLPDGTNIPGVDAAALAIPVYEPGGLAVDLTGNLVVADQQSGLWTLTPPTYSAPSAPTSVTASASNGSARVSFVAPADNGGSSVYSYTVTSTPGAKTCTTDVYTGLACTVPALTNGTPYTFTVTASSAGGTSVASDPSNTVTPTAPPFTFLNAASSPSSVFYGGAAKLYGASNAPVGHKLTVQYKTPTGTTWYTLGTVTTTSTSSTDGFNFSIPSVVFTRDYRFIDPTTLVVSKTFLLSVTPKVTPASRHITVALGKTATVSGTVAPNFDGVRGEVQYYNGKAWVNYVGVIIHKKTASISTYSYSWVTKSKSNLQWRISIPTHNGYNAVVSAGELVTIN